MDRREEVSVYRWTDCRGRAAIRIPGTYTKDSSPALTSPSTTNINADTNTTQPNTAKQDRKYALYKQTRHPLRPLLDADHRPPRLRPRRHRHGVRFGHRPRHHATPAGPPVPGLRP